MFNKFRAYGHFLSHNAVEQHIIYRVTQGVGAV
jgi:hypothetical protein